MQHSSGCDLHDSSTHGAAAIRELLPRHLGHDMATPGPDRSDPTALVRSLWQSGGETVWSAKICFDGNCVNGVNDAVRCSVLAALGLFVV